MKKIELVDQVMRRPMENSGEISYRQGFLSCLNTLNIQGRDPYESVKVVALSTKLYQEGPDWVLENSDFELLKKAVEQNNVGFVAFILGQLLNKIQESKEISLSQGVEVK